MREYCKAFIVVVVILLFAPPNFGRLGRTVRVSLLILDSPSLLHTVYMHSERGLSRVSDRRIYWARIA